MVATPMDLKSVQSVLDRCKVPNGTFTARHDGIELNIGLPWLGSWLSDRKYAMVSPKGEGVTVHFGVNGVPWIWEAYNTESLITDLAFSVYRAGMLHEASEFFLFDGVQRYDPHCTDRASSHFESPALSTLTIERRFQDTARCVVGENDQFGIPPTR